MPYNNVLTQFAELFQENIEITAAYYINKKVNKDTLSDSDVLDSLQISVEDNELIISINSYYRNIESGREKGEKQIRASVIIAWLKKKRIVPTNRAGNFRGKKFKTTNRKSKTPDKKLSINQLAWIISRSIKTKGIKKRPFVSEAFKETINEMENLINIETEKVLEGTLKNILKPFRD